MDKVGSCCCSTSYFLGGVTIQRVNTLTPPYAAASWVLRRRVIDRRCHIYVLRTQLRLHCSVRKRGSIPVFSHASNLPYIPTAPLLSKYRIIDVFSLHFLRTSAIFPNGLVPNGIIGQFFFQVPRHESVVDLAELPCCVDGTRFVHAELRSSVKSKAQQITPEVWYGQNQTLRSLLKVTLNTSSRGVVVYLILYVSFLT